MTCGNAAPQAWVEAAQVLPLVRGRLDEIVARAVEAESGQPIVVMQTIRFEPGRYVRMVGLTRAEQRDDNLRRFRAVIDGVEMSP